MDLDMAGALSFGAVLVQDEVVQVEPHPYAAPGEAWAWRLVARLTFRTPHATVNVEAGRAGDGARRRKTPYTTVNVEAACSIHCGVS